jgi:hypothetical protein
LKRKKFVTSEGVHWYEHVTGTDFFDTKLYPRKDKREWKEIIGTSGQNAERKAKSKCTSVFNHAMRLLFDELAEHGGYIRLPIYKMGYICRDIKESKGLLPETINRKADLRITISHDFASYIKKKYYVRLTRRGRGKLVNSIKVKKRGTVRKY